MSDVITDQTGAYEALGQAPPVGASADGTSNSGTGSLLIDGSGIVTLSGANSYTGGITLASGTLVLASATAAGFGNITFAPGSRATIVARQTPANTIYGFSGGDVIHPRL